MFPWRPKRKWLQLRSDEQLILFEGIHLIKKNKTIREKLVSSECVKRVICHIAPFARKVNYIIIITFTNPNIMVSKFKPEIVTVATTIRRQLHSTKCKDKKWDNNCREHAPLDFTLLAVIKLMMSKRTVQYDAQCFI